MDGFQERIIPLAVRVKDAFRHGIEQEVGKLIYPIFLFVWTFSPPDERLKNVK